MSFKKRVHSTHVVGCRVFFRSDHWGHRPVSIPRLFYLLLLMVLPAASSTFLTLLDPGTFKKCPASFSVSSFPLSHFPLHVVLFSDSLFPVVPNSFKLPLFATINLSRKARPEQSLSGYLCVTCQHLKQPFGQGHKTP